MKSVQTDLLALSHCKETATENCLGLWLACQNLPSVSPRLQLQSLLLWHYSSVRWRLPLPMSICILGGNQAGLDPSTASDQGRGVYCQHRLQCTHSGGSETSSRAEMIITGVHFAVHTWVGVKPAQWCGINPSSLNQPLRKACKPGKK